MRSMGRLSATVAGVLLLAGGVWLLVSSKDDSGGPNPGGSSGARIPLPPRHQWFGFSGGAFEYTGREADDIGATPERTAADAVAAGANSVRVPFSWWETEPNPGKLDYQYLGLMDRFVRALQKRGGRVLFFLGGPPPWASTHPGDPGAKPRADRYSFFGRFAAFVAKRYPHAAGIETWNEPNAVFSWRPAPEPKSFAKLHKVAARAIRQVAPRMKVILGGLAGAVEDNPQVMRPSRFLKAMYAAGLRPSDYDALAFHPYPSQSGGQLQGLDDGVFAALFEDFRAGYRARDPGAQVWITETGLTTSGPDAVSPQTQADGIVPLVRKLLTMRRVKAVYVHSEYDLTTRPQSSPQRGFGLLTTGGSRAGTPKPAFCALRKLDRTPAAFAGCG